MTEQTSAFEDLSPISYGLIVVAGKPGEGKTRFSNTLQKWLQQAGVSTTVLDRNEARMHPILPLADGTVKILTVHLQRDGHPPSSRYIDGADIYIDLAADTGGVHWHCTKHRRGRCPAGYIPWDTMESNHGK